MVVVLSLAVQSFVCHAHKGLMKPGRAACVSAEIGMV